MFVCICNGYRDSEIRAAADAGVRCARRVYNLLGGEPRCGRCLSVAQGLIDQIHDDAAAAAAHTADTARIPDR